MSAIVMPPEESEAKQKDETVQPEADEQDPDQDTGKSKPANGNQAAGQPNANSTTAQPPLRVSQRTQNAKKQGRNEASDCTYNKKSKVSLVGCSNFKFGACRPL